MPANLLVAVLHPRPHGLRALLEALDLLLLDLGQPDVVEPFKQAMLAVRIDLELDHAAVRAPDLLLLEINRERRVGAALRVEIGRAHGLNSSHLVISYAVFC